MATFYQQMMTWVAAQMTAGPSGGSGSIPEYTVTRVMADVHTGEGRATYADLVAAMPDITLVPGVSGKQITVVFVQLRLLAFTDWNSSFSVYGAMGAGVKMVNGDNMLEVAADLREIAAQGAGQITIVANPFFKLAEGESVKLSWDVMPEALTNAGRPETLPGYDITVGYVVEDVPAA